MLSDAVKHRPPGGKRVGKVEVERRLAEVERLARAGLARSVVVAECERRFGISATTTDTYLRRVRERWAADGAEARATERERAIARLRDISLKAEARGAFSAAVNAERLAADILGLKSPERVDVRASVAASPPGALLSYDQALEELTEAVAMLAGSVASGAVTPTDDMRTHALELLGAIDARLAAPSVDVCGPH